MKLIFVDNLMIEITFHSNGNTVDGPRHCSNLQKFTSLYTRSYVIA